MSTKKIQIINGASVFPKSIFEYSGMDSFPDIGEEGKLYIDTSTNLIYRWDNTQYVEIKTTVNASELQSYVDEAILKGAW